MPIIVDRKSNNLWESKKETDQNKIRSSHQKMLNLNKYLTTINMAPQNRSMRAFAMDLADFITADMHVRDRISQLDFDLKRLPDIADFPTCKSQEDLETRETTMTATPSS